MAYAFKKIDDLIDKEKKQSNTNLFQTPQEPQQQDGQVEQKKVAPAQAVSTNASTGGSSFAKLGEQTRPQQQYSQQGAYKAAVDANTGKTQIPGAIGKIGESLEKQQQEDIDRAAGGDAAAAGRLGGVLHPGAPRPVPEFPEGKVELPKDISLNRPEGIRKELERGKGQNYTRGQSDFDLLTLTGSQEFPRKIRELLAGQNQLSSKAKQLAEERKKESEEYIKNKILEQKGLTEQELAKYTEDLNRTEEEKLNKWNGELNSAYEEAKRQDPEFRSRHLGQAVQDFLAKIDATGSGISNNLKEIIRNDVLSNPENVYKYISRGELKTPVGGPAGGFTKESADRYNRINALLGRSERKQGGFENVPEHPDVSGYRGDPYKHDVEGAYKEYVTPDRVYRSVQKGVEDSLSGKNSSQLVNELSRADLSRFPNDIATRIFKDPDLKNDIENNFKNGIKTYTNSADIKKVDDLLKKSGYEPGMYKESERRSLAAKIIGEKVGDNELLNYSVGALKNFRNSPDFNNFMTGKPFSDTYRPVTVSNSEASRYTKELQKIPGFEKHNVMGISGFIRDQKASEDFAKKYGL